MPISSTSASTPGSGSLGTRMRRPSRFSTRFAAITQLGACLTCEGHVAELLDNKGEKQARIVLTTKDEKGEIKLAGEAIIAL